jgi:hypothetical protein
MSCPDDITYLEGTMIHNERTVTRKRYAYAHLRALAGTPYARDKPHALAAALMIEGLTVMARINANLM